MLPRLPNQTGGGKVVAGSCHTEVFLEWMDACVNEKVTGTMRLLVTVGTYYKTGGLDALRVGIPFSCFYYRFQYIQSALGS